MTRRSVVFVTFVLLHSSLVALSNSDSIVCPTDVQLCPDGKTYVKRDNTIECAFEACPEIKPTEATSTEAKSSSTVETSSSTAEKSDPKVEKSGATEEKSSTTTENHNTTTENHNTTTENHNTTSTNSSTTAENNNAASTNSSTITVNANTTSTNSNPNERNAPTKTTNETNSTNTNSTTKGPIPQHGKTQSNHSTSGHKRGFQYVKQDVKQLLPAVKNATHNAFSPWKQAKNFKNITLDVINVEVGQVEEHKEKPESERLTYYRILLRVVYVLEGSEDYAVKFRLDFSVTPKQFVYLEECQNVIGNGFENWLAMINDVTVCENPAQQGTGNILNTRGGGVAYMLSPGNPIDLLNTMYDNLDRTTLITASSAAGVFILIMAILAFLSIRQQTRTAKETDSNKDDKKPTTKDRSGTNSMEEMEAGSKETEMQDAVLDKEEKKAKEKKKVDELDSPKEMEREGSFMSIRQRKRSV